MSKIVLLASLLTAPFAQADIIVCRFTEPFYNTTYSMVQQSLTVEDFEGNTNVIRNVSFQIMGAGLFELRDKDNNVLQTLNLNNEGSDGMGQAVYPYSVQSSDKVYAPGVNNGIGGCTSNFLHASE